MSEFKLTVVNRNEQGKGASRRLRKANLIPAIVYGGKGEPVAISIRKNELVKAIESESFFSSLIVLDNNGETEEVIIKAMQRHPAKGFPMHADFQRIVRGVAMNFHVPVHFVGTSVGVKAGGILSANITEVEVSCLPRQLPEFIEVDVTNLDIGGVLHLSDIKLPEGLSLVELASGGDKTIVSIVPPTAKAE